MVAGDKHQLLELEELLYVLVERGWTETQTESGLDLPCSRRWWTLKGLKPRAMEACIAGSGPLGLEQLTDRGAPESPILPAAPGGLILCLSLPGEMFALPYIPTEQIDLFKNVN